MLSRMKFEIEPLVAEILDQLPSSVWTDDTTTFLDPAIGGGQFVRAIEQRLRAAGHSEFNICSRVFGFEESNLHIRFAVNKYKLVGQYVKSSYEQFLESDNNMKFDVIVGNPPYQDGANNSNQNKIYNQFSKKAITLLTHAGIIAFITPTSVLKVSKRFSLIGQHGLKLVDFRANNFFTVGTTICWWLVDKTYSGKVTVKCNSGSAVVNVADPIYDYSKTDSNFATLYESLKKETNSPSKRMFRQNNFGPAFSKVKDLSHPYPLFKLDHGKELLTCYSSRVPYLLNKNKFIISRTKSFNENAIIISNNDYDTAHMFVEIASNEEIENIKSFLFSDYFIAHSIQWKAIDGYGFNDCLKYIPPFDQTKKWSETEVKEFIEGFIND